MAVNPYCIAECFCIFKYKPVCMAVIHDTEPADPFPFYQGVKTFCAGIVPWAGSRLNLMSAAVAVGYMDQGFERKLQSHFSRAIRRRMRRGSSETARRGRNISEQEKHTQYTIRRLSLLSADSLPRIGQFQRPCLVHIRQFRQLFALFL